MSKIRARGELLTNVPWHLSEDDVESGSHEMRSLTN